MSAWLLGSATYVILSGERAAATLAQASIGLTAIKIDVAIADQYAKRAKGTDV